MIKYLHIRIKVETYKTTTSRAIFKNIQLYNNIIILVLKSLHNLFLQCINHSDPSFFFIWNHHKCPPASFEYICHGSTAITITYILPFQCLYRLDPSYSDDVRQNLIYEAGPRSERVDMGLDQQTDSCHVQYFNKISYQKSIKYSCLTKSNCIDNYLWKCASYLLLLLDGLVYKIVQEIDIFKTNAQERVYEMIA